MKVSLSPISREDFFRLTGLKDIHGAACLDRYQCVHTTLAAVVQSRDRIPATAFKDQSAIATNCDEINTLLKNIYSEVRKRLNETNGDLQSAWQSLSSATTPNVATAPAEVAPTPAAPSQPPKVATQPAAAATANSFFTPSTGGSKPFGGFSFGPAVPAAAPVFGFGKAPPGAGVGGESTPAPSGFGFSFGGNVTAAPPPPPKASQPPAPKKEIVFAEPQYFTGPFLEMPTFWEKEVLARSTIFNLDKGFVAANKDALRARMLEWAQPCLAFYGTKVRYAPITDRDEETARVILRDADRTFLETEHREKFAEFLHSMFIELNAYGQAMGYLAAICSIGLTEQETAAILRRTAKEVLQGHWAAEAVGFASNAWVFEHILKAQQPDVAKHFEQLNFWPDTYLQKILSGLCVHVLPFNLLFDFLDKFMAGGMSFLFRFCLGITQVFRTQLLETESYDTLFSIMKLDSSMVTSVDVQNIFAAADKIDIRDFPLQELKSEKYNDKILPRLAKAPKTLEFEPCTACEVNKPTKYNDELGVFCEECAAKHPNLEWDDW